MHVLTDLNAFMNGNVVRGFINNVSEIHFLMERLHEKQNRNNFKKRVLRHSIMDSNFLKNDDDPLSDLTVSKHKRKKKPKDNIYRIDKTFYEGKKQQIRGQEIEYRKRPPSARHSGLRPLMVALLSLIHKASQIAIHRDMEFFGLTLYECQNALSECGVSNDTVRDNLRKLTKLKLLKKKHHKPDKKKFRYTFYNINKETFPCRDGVWIIMDVDDESGGDTLMMDPASTFFVINCNDYPFCSLDPEHCKMESNLRRLRGVLDQHLHGLENRITQFNKKDIAEFYTKNEDDESKIKKKIKVKKKKKVKKDS